MRQMSKKRLNIFTIIILRLFNGGGLFDWKESKLGGKPASYIVRR